MHALMSIEYEDFKLFAGSGAIGGLSKQCVTHVAGANKDVPGASSNMCLVGETLIDCPRDLTKYPKGIPISELVGKKFWTYGWRNGRVVLAYCEKVWLTKKNARVVRVNLTRYDKTDSGPPTGQCAPPCEIIGTADHLVLLSNGKWKQLGKLRPGDSICSMYRRLEGREPMIRWTRCKKSKYQESRFILSELYGERDGKKYQVHHRDENPHNESPENLEWCETSAHKSFHAEVRNGLKEFGPDWQSQEHPRGMRGKRHTSAAKEKISRAAKKMRARRRKINHTVVSVEDGWYADVYDMSVPETENFIANGIVVHNSGKSTLMTMLTWCLYECDLVGNVMRSNVVTHGKKKCSVRCYFQTPKGTPFIVTRSRTSTRGSELEITFRGRTRKGACADLQSRIDHRFGTRELFIASHVFGYSDTMTPFALQGDVAQKKLLDLLIDTYDIDQALQTARELYSACVRKHEKLRGKVEAQRETLDNAKSVNPYDADAHAKAISSAARLTYVYGIAAKKLRKAENNTTKILNSLDKHIERAREEWNAKREKRANGIMLDMARVQARIETCKANIALVNGKKCATCGQEIQDAKKKRAEYESLLSALRDESSKLRDILRNQDMAIDAAKQSVDRLEEAYNKQKCELAANVNARRTNVDDVKSKLSKAQADIRYAEKMKQRGESNIALLETILADTTTRERRMRRDKEALQFWIDAFGPRGLRAMRLENITPLLNACAARHSASLFGDGHVVTYSTQTENKTGGMRERFDIAILDSSARRVESPSAGQSMRRDIIHALSMAELASTLGKRSVNMLVLDEAFRTLDETGIDRVCETLNVLSVEWRTPIYVIEHDDDSASRFGRHLVVTRESGASKARYSNA